MIDETFEDLRTYTEQSSEEQIRERMLHGPNTLTSLDNFLADGQQVTELTTEIAHYLKDKSTFIPPSAEDIRVSLAEIREGVKYVADTYGTVPLGFFVTEELVLSDGTSVRDKPGYLREAKSIVFPYSFFQDAGMVQARQAFFGYRQNPGEYIPGNYYYRFVAIEEAAHGNQDIEGRLDFPAERLISVKDDPSEREIDAYFRRAVHDLGVPVYKIADDNIFLKLGNELVFVKDPDLNEQVNLPLDN